MQVLATILRTAEAAEWSLEQWILDIRGGEP